jgi:hypothetical protein
MNKEKITKKKIEKCNRILKTYARKLQHRKKILANLTALLKKIKLSAGVRRALGKKCKQI